MKNNPIRLLVLVSAFARNKNDSGDFTLDLSLLLKKNGLDMTVLCPSDCNLKRQENIKGLDVYRFAYFYPQSIQRLAYGAGMPENLKTSFLAKIQVPFFILSELIAAIRLIRYKKINVIQSHWLIPQGLVGSICQKYYHIPHVATIHSSEVTILRKLPLGKKLTEFILLNSTRIISVSHHRFEELMAFISPEVAKKIREKTDFIPMGIAMNSFSRRFSKKSLLANNNLSPTILFVGRLVEVKGVNYLIRAFPLIQRKFKLAKLLIVGDGPLKQELKELAVKLKIHDKVQFLGFIDHRKMADFYNLSDVTVFPSIIDASGYQEGMPVVLLEALSSRNIVVAADTPGVREVIEDGINGYLAKQKNSQDLAQKIILALENNNSKVMKIEARKTVQMFDWGKVARKYSEVIENANFK